MSAICRLLLALVASGGCRVADALAPPEVVLGEDTCDYCHMIITDDRYLSAYIDADGKKSVFDDIGGMVLRWRQTGDEVAAWWVHDYHSRQWLRAENATFAHCPALMTPMAYGMASFANDADAAAFASECGAETLAFQDLLAHPFGEGRDDTHEPHQRRDP